MVLELFFGRWCPFRWGFGMEQHVGWPGGPLAPLFGGGFRGPYRSPKRLQGVCVLAESMPSGFHLGGAIRDCHRCHCGLKKDGFSWSMKQPGQPGTTWIAKLLFCSITVAGFWGKVDGKKRSQLAIQASIFYQTNDFITHTLHTKFIFLRRVNPRTPITPTAAAAH